MTTLRQIADGKTLEAYGTSEGVKKEWDERGRGRTDRDLVKYTVEMMENAPNPGLAERPQIRNEGGTYIWDHTGAKILMGPFDSREQAETVRSRALDKALKVYNKRHQ